jgi:hypothetical protein
MRSSVKDIDRLRLIIKRGTALSDECEAIALAVDVLGLDADDLSFDHPLVALYRALYILQYSGGIVCLSDEQQKYLEHAIYLLERNIDVSTFRRFYVSAAADRLRLMTTRSCVFADEREDVAFALLVFGLDPTNPEADHPLIDLYIALIFVSGSSGSIHLDREHKRWLSEAYHRQLTRT